MERSYVSLALYQALRESGGKSSVMDPEREAIANQDIGHRSKLYKIGGDGEIKLFGDPWNSSETRTNAAKAYLRQSEQNGRVSRSEAGGIAREYGMTLVALFTALGDYRHAMKSLKRQRECNGDA